MYIKQTNKRTTTTTTKQSARYRNTSELTFPDIYHMVHELHAFENYPVKNTLCQPYTGIYILSSLQGQV